MIKWSFNGTTIAGSERGDYGSDPALLYWALDAFIDKNDTLYVLDSTNLRVKRYFTNDTIGTIIISGEYGSGLNQFMQCKIIKLKRIH